MTKQIKHIRKYPKRKDGRRKIGKFEAGSKIRYMGIADCHGIESFIPLKGNEKQAFYFKMRANANRQRHAVLYVVDLDKGQAGLIKDTIEKGEYIKALKFLKAVPVMFPEDMATLYSKSWKLIPNPELDPWRKWNDKNKTFN